VGQLSLLPLPAAWLPDASRPTGRRYLTDSFTIRYLPSARLLPRPEASAATDSFFGVADPKSQHAPPLAYANAEIAIASSTFPAKQVVAGDAATAQAVEAGAAAAAVVHLCCHALCNFSYPDDSVLSLAGADVLPLWNVARMDFSGARLVVLSACESSRISRKSYDQAVSFASALLGAGARAAIATGWSIDDPATSVLMLRFYHGWRVRNLPPAAALQEAQQWLRDTTNGEKADFCESLLPEFGGTGVLDAEAVGSIYRLVALLPPAGRRYAHPHYWAAFMYSGVEADH
jgi:CHAT domain-containing protein